MRLGAEVSGYLEAVAARAGAALGPELVGVWLTGSAALGDFAPERSDLDVQAISATRVPLDARRALAEALSHPNLPCPVRGLEFVLYAREDLSRNDGPAFSLNLNTGPGMTQHAAYDPGDDPRFWFVVDVSIARQHAVPLGGGPAAASAFPELPRALVVAALAEALAWYAAEGGLPAQTILGACRTWAWATDGRWRSKGESAAWVRERLADPGPVDRALGARDAPTAAPSGADVEAVLAPARAALLAAAAGTSAP